MITIKIQCGCGQRYAFDAEPVHGRMPYAVTCPLCGVDGTAAANEIIAQSMPRDTAAPAAPPVRVAAAAVAPSVHLASARPSAPRVTHLPGQMDRSQVKHEARAKILWGDEPPEVVRFLMGQGIPRPEASEIVDELFQERAAEIRGKGIVKLVGGGVLICVPIAAWIIFNNIGFVLVKTFTLTIAAGLYGLWLVLRGAIMIFTPKSEAGDVSAE